MKKNIQPNVNGQQYIWRRTTQ